MKLSPKQKKFCENYVINGYNATSAYIDAGYSVKKRVTGTVNSSQLLMKPNIQSYIRTLELERDGDFKIGKEEILAELGKLAFGNLDDIVEIKNNSFGLRDDIDPKKRRIALAGISSISSSSSFGKEGQSKSFSINAKDKIKALELIAKMTGVLDGDTDSGDGRSSISRVLNSLRNIKK